MSLPGTVPESRTASLRASAARDRPTYARLHRVCLEEKERPLWCSQVVFECPRACLARERKEHATLSFFSVLTSDSRKARCAWQRVSIAEKGGAGTKTARFGPLGEAVGASLHLRGHARAREAESPTDTKVSICAINGNTQSFGLSSFHTRVSPMYLETSRYVRSFSSFAARTKARFRALTGKSPNASSDSVSRPLPPLKFSNRVTLSCRCALDAGGRERTATAPRARHRHWPQQVHQHRRAPRQVRYHRRPPLSRPSPQPARSRRRTASVCGFVILTRSRSRAMRLFPENTQQPLFFSHVYASRAISFSREEMMGKDAPVGRASQKCARCRTLPSTSPPTTVFDVRETRTATTYCGRNRPSWHVPDSPWL